VSKRIAIAAAFLLLLVQAVPALACVAMPAQALITCCCEPDRNCATAGPPGDCAVPETCCVQATGLAPALSASAAHPVARLLALPVANGAPFADVPLALIKQRASLLAAELYRHSTAAPSAVPLYLRHLRLTL